MIKSRPMLTRFMVFIALPLLILLWYLYSHLIQSLPPTQGQFEIAGIDAPIHIKRDALGIVNIEAKTDSDAFFALGYAHAQDRLWQLEVQKRTTQGRLSEMFGRQSVNMDIWFRTLGLYPSAATAWNGLSDEAKMSLKAYASGINAWIDSKPVWPAEFILLDIEPQHWHVNDSLAYIKLFALNLSGNFRQEIARLLAAQLLTATQMSTVFDHYPVDGPVTAKVTQLPVVEQHKFASLLTLQHSIENDLKNGGRYVGSNAWVVAPQHSQNGQALLANDPHLGLQMPSLWYAASLQGDKLSVSGMTLVGLPLVVFGRNEQISWGGTAMMTDNQDLYFERLKVDDHSVYLANGQWLKFDVRREVIEVRADFPSSMRIPIEAIEIDVRSTRHGPVISDVYRVFDNPVSLRWTALADNDTTYESFFRLNYADDWDSFNAALSYQVAPNLNLLYSDRQGNIGYVGAGQIPMRKKGQGMLPVKGWDDEYQWVGFVSSEQWPSSYNPSKGFIVNANNKVVGDDYPHFISSNWAPPARAERITQLLQQKLTASAGQPAQQLSVDDMRDIQADTLSLPAQVLLPQLIKLQPNNEAQQQAIDLLSRWHGDMRYDSQAATLYAVWSRLLKETIFADDLAGAWDKQGQSRSLGRLVAGISNRNLVTILTRQDDTDGFNWCNDINTEVVESCQHSLSKSLDQTIEQLSKLKGNNQHDWQWGEVQHTAYDHLPFSQIKILDGFFARKIGNGGGANTVNVAASSFDETEGYQQTFGAGFRQIIGLSADSTTHMIMNSTGQSGNLLSENYDDMVKPFSEVSFVSMDSQADEASDLQKSIQLLPISDRKKRIK